MTFHIRRIFFTAVMLFGLLWELNAQVHDSLSVKKPGWFTGISVGVGQSELVPETNSAIAKTIFDKGSMASGTAEIGYFFSEHIGLSTGIHFSHGTGTSSLASYSGKFTTTDSEKEAYERRISGNNIAEKQSIALLGIPLTLHLRLPLSPKMGMFLQPSVTLSLPVTKKYTTNGTFTYKGYYPAYNVLLENLPDYGFPTNAALSTDGALGLKSFFLTGQVAAGFDFNLQPKLRLSVAAFYDQTLTSIISDANTEAFQLSPDASLINSLLGGSKKTLLQDIGVSIALHYFIHP